MNGVWLLLLTAVVLAGCNRTPVRINLCLADCRMDEAKPVEPPPVEPKYIVIEQPPVARPVIRYYK